MTNAKGTARIGGVELEYVRIDGDPSAPTLVFLHEGLGSVEGWHDFPARLCKLVACPGLVYSRYGNGRSTVLRESRLVSYMHDEALQMLPALLESLSIRSVVLYGHSDGASIAMLYAAEHSEHVTGLMLEAPHVFVEDLSVRSIAAIRATYERGDLRRRFARYHADPDKTFYGWNDIWLSPEFAAWNIEAALERLRFPTFVIQGRDDQYGTLAQVDAIARRHPDTDALVLARCGHAPHREQERLVIELAGRWLADRVLGR